MKNVSNEEDYFNFIINDYKKIGFSKLNFQKDSKIKVGENLFYILETEYVNLNNMLVYEKHLVKTSKNLVLSINFTSNQPINSEYSKLFEKSKMKDISEL